MINPYDGVLATQSQLNALVAAAESSIEVLRDGIARKNQPQVLRSTVSNMIVELGTPLFEELDDMLGQF